VRKRRVKSTSDAAEHATPLVRVLDQSESVQEKVEAAATDLASVNVVLKDEVHRGAPLQDVRGALDKSIDVEVKMQEAAGELIAVNDALAIEIDDRIAIQLELVESKAALTVSLVEERRARHDALHDDVTGLPNAALFKDRLQSALVQARRHAWGFAVMFIDLDGFKAINDRHGHDIGDGVLRLVADRLREFVRDGDTVSRRSGDEFLYLMLEVKDEASAQAMAQRILALLAAPAIVDGVSVAVRASIGLARFPADGTSAEALLKHADLAMYEVKRQRAALRDG
jgi:diguanylate cyclase